MNKLEFKNVTIRYQQRAGSNRRAIDAVKNISLAVREGGALGLAGESGSGKSTLAMSILRLLPKNAKIEGEILLNGESVADMSWGRLRVVRWTEAAVVFQGAMHALNPVKRVNEQIAEAIELHAVDELAPLKDPKLRAERVDELLRQVDLSPAKGQSFPHQLSGGQKQRVMIAMALACEPHVIIADEPTTALDVIVQAQVLDLLKEKAAERNLTLLMISHDLTVLATVCDEIGVMYKGELIEHGPSNEVLTNPQHPHTAKLAAAFPLIGDPSSRLSLPNYTAPDAPTAGPEVKLTEAVRQIESVADLSTQSISLEQVTLAARNLTVEFGRGSTHNVAVNNVNLTCRPGEIIALVGQSGSGKTTLARTMLGLQQPTDGEVMFRGDPLPTKQRHLKEYRRKVQYVLQDPMAALNSRHTVYEQVAEGIRVQGIKGDERELVARALAAAELDPPEEFFNSYPFELSGGQRQRVVIAGALALNPEFLIADEPVASLDASVRAGVLALFLRLRSERGLGALIITHDLGLAWNIADRVAVMYRGEIVEHGPVDEVLLNPQHPYTRKLLSVVPTRDSADITAESEGI
ncbi:ABC transporter ATP-binding protein [Gulosibacter hominis]|uniref:ABC transporter ATP-binding protein n=1 Tax=Gulosibacter hominis TaxID=2770504 RepID=UPI001917AA2A|nr:ABC transporter ATP-binding protein [Gulosibacter hominis]